MIRGPFPRHSVRHRAAAPMGGTVWMGGTLWIDPRRMTESGPTIIHRRDSARASSALRPCGPIGSAPVPAGRPGALLQDANLQSRQTAAPYRRVEARHFDLRLATGQGSRVHTAGIQGQRRAREPSDSAPTTQRQCRMTSWRDSSAPPSTTDTWSFAHASSRGSLVPLGGRPRRAGRPPDTPRPASSRTRRSRNSIWALVLRSSSAAQRASASCTAGSRRSRMFLRSATGECDDLLLVQGAGIDDGLRSPVTAQHHQEIRDHGRLAFFVQVDDTLLGETNERHLHHADRALDNA